MFRCAGCLILAIFSLAAISLPTYGASQGQIEYARVKGLAWLFLSQRGDGSWTGVSGLEVHSTAAALGAYANAGIRSGTSYNAAMAWTGAANSSSIDGKARQLGALSLTVTDITIPVQQLIKARNIYTAWGSLPGYGSNVADTALALREILRSGYGPSYLVADVGNALCNVILPTQTGNGGWTYLALGNGMPTNSASPSIVPTAYAVLLLQHVVLSGYTGSTCGTSSYTFSTVINSGVNFLTSKQKTDGGFGDESTSGVLETALAYMAIQSANAGHTALAPATDYLIGQQLADGSWATDPLQTGFVLATFPATTLVQSANDGIPDAVKSLAPPSTVGVLSGNGLAAEGTNKPILLSVVGILGVPYTYVLGGTSGKLPYTVSLASGMLPGGIALASNGTLSGTPNAIGTFNFTYKSVDSQGTAEFIAAQLRVEDGTQGIPLPWDLVRGWNLIGNGSTSSFDVATWFGGDPTAVFSVWKWLANFGTWAFYTPTQADGGEAYAVSQGFEFLTTINSGEGFWVYAGTAFSLEPRVAALLNSSAFQPGGSNALPRFWNLIATGDNKTPSDFNKALSNPPPAPGTIPDNIISLWAWDPRLGAWYFYSPAMERDGTLLDYVNSQGFLDFGISTLTPTTGFWIRKP